MRPEAMKRDPFIEEFINLYRQNPCLWNVRSQEYRDREKKRLAYKVLAKKLQEREPDADREAVIRKINNLRTSYRKEVRKVWKVTAKGGSYTPTLWYFDLFSFLIGMETRKNRKFETDVDASDVELQVRKLDESGN